MRGHASIDTSLGVSESNWRSIHVTRALLPRSVGAETSVLVVICRARRSAVTVRSPAAPGTRMVPSS